MVQPLKGLTKLVNLATDSQFLLLSQFHSVIFFCAKLGLLD
jgi:hypothetical protein